MSMKDLKEAMKVNAVYFGIRQTLKNFKKLENVFIAKDARDETVEKLESSGVEFIVLRPKSEMTRELNLDFESEVFSIAKISKK